MPKNDYARKLQLMREEREYIIKQWTAQLSLDVVADILNDPEVMGKDTLGAKRLQKVGHAFNERFSLFSTALTKNPEADYIRAKIDEKQRRIFGPDSPPWEDRYIYWEEDKFR